MGRGTLPAEGHVDGAGPMGSDGEESGTSRELQRTPRSITNLLDRKCGTVSVSQLKVDNDKMSPRKKSKSTKKKAKQSTPAKRPVQEVTKMTQAAIDRNNTMYAEQLPNWTTHFSSHAPHRVTQADWDGKFVEAPDDASDGAPRFEATTLTLAKMEQRRAAWKDQGVALSLLLDYESVSNLLANDALPPSLAREWGACVQGVRGTVPFNMVAKGLEDVPSAWDEDGRLGNPPVPPPPRTDTEQVLGLLSPSSASTLHFKGWYEDAPGCNFEKDLLMPLLEAFRQYSIEYPKVRHYPLGRKSAKGRTPAPDAPCRRKHAAKTYEAMAMAPWPSVDMSFPGEEGASDEELSDEDDGAPMYVTQSGAPLFFVPPSVMRTSTDEEETKKPPAENPKASDADSTTAPGAKDAAASVLERVARAASGDEAPPSARKSSVLVSPTAETPLRGNHARTEGGALEELMREGGSDSSDDDSSSYESSERE